MTDRKIAFMGGAIGGVVGFAVGALWYREMVLREWEAAWLEFSRRWR